MKNKLQRHIAIREAVIENNVTNQDQLLSLLKDKGFDLTQATLSRDIKALKIGKQPDPKGGYIYVISSSAQVISSTIDNTGANFLADGFLSIDFSGNMAVVKTKPAYASSIAAIIDSANSFEILGTIAGDDTIFIVLRNGVEEADVINFLIGVMPKLKTRL